MAFFENIDVPRNGHSHLIYQYLNDNEEPHNLTGAVMSSTARDISGGTVLASAVVAPVVASEGLLSITWSGPAFDAYGEVTAVSVASYDLKIIRADGLIDIIMRGHLNIIPENTA